MKLYQICDMKLFSHHWDPCDSNDKVHHTDWYSFIATYWLWRWLLELVLTATLMSWLSCWYFALCIAWRKPDLQNPVQTKSTMVNPLTQHTRGPLLHRQHTAHTAHNQIPYRPAQDDSTSVVFLCIMWALWQAKQSPKATIDSMGFAAVVNGGTRGSKRLYDATPDGTPR